MSTQRTKAGALEPRRNHLETHNERDGSLHFNNDLLPDLRGNKSLRFNELSVSRWIRVLSLENTFDLSKSRLFFLFFFYFELFILNITVARIVESTWSYPSLRFTDSLADVFLVLMLAEWQPSLVLFLSPSGTFGPTGSLHGKLLEGWEQVGMGEV